MTTEQRAGFPIHRWKLKNFKSVEEADVELAPLTILVGPNSSGKSSLLQSILLIAQAAQEGPAPWLPLNGPLVELGDVHDVVFAGKPSGEGPAKQTGKRSKHFEIGGEFDIDISARLVFQALDSIDGKNRTRVSWQAAFGSMPGGTTVGAAAPRSMTMTLVTDETEEDWRFKTTGKRRKALEVLSSGRFGTELGEVLPLRGKLVEFAAHRHEKLFGRHRDSSVLQPETRNTAGLVQVGGIPVQFFLEEDRITFETMALLRRLRNRSVHGPRSNKVENIDRLDPKTRESIEAEVARALVMELEDEQLGRRRPIMRLKFSKQAEHFLGRLNDNQAKRIANIVRKGIRKRRQVLVPAEPFGLERVGNTLATFMARNVRYLGPLREDPRIVYLPTPGEREGKVGKKGEKAVALLHTHGDDEISCFYSDGRAPDSNTLAAGVKHWLQFFGIAKDIDTELRPRLGLEPHLDLPDVDRPLDMTAVGVGVSQIFPVLVMGLHSKPGSVLLMEQPELHLHPALQQRLGDFLLACARSGRQLIVETHSDHLISRLRLRIAEDETDRLHENLAIIFAERHEGRTTYRQVQVNRFGGIEEWPQGFFDQAAKESQLILRAGLAKKKQEIDQSQ